MSELQVRYVGSKPKEIDHLYGTNIVWEFKGDVKPVPAAAWEAGMRRHPDVWELALEAPAEKSAEPVAEPVSAAPAEQAPDLYTLNTAALREYAAAKGYDVDLTLKGQALRTAIMSAGG